ncbi:hypothetical protein MLX47_022585, partial [Escherichia coli]|nr:hypothetical protein [Escherichia coli]
IGYGGIMMRRKASLLQAIGSIISLFPAVDHFRHMATRSSMGLARDADAIRKDFQKVSGVDKREKSKGP